MKEIVTPYDLIVEKLKKDYPIGTRFYSVLSPDSDYDYEVECHDFFKYAEDEITVNRYTGPSIYRNGIFAEIISIPEPIVVNQFPIY